jgi:hypothetical protein
MNTEKNKLIAEFISSENPFHVGHYICPNGIATEPKDMRFHFDYNWLMEVVEKIENTQPISIIISCGNCEVYNCEKAETLFFFEGVKIEAVYNACVAFIEWHNKNK